MVKKNNIAILTPNLHLIAQYLAAANMSFTDAKPDDSHTNLGWQNGSLITHSLNNNGLLLAFNYSSYSLTWLNANRQITFPLEGKAHQQVLVWLKRSALQVGLEDPYNYDFHYDLPYSIDSVSPFNKPAVDKLATFADRRSTANKVMLQFLENIELDAPIRIWPHHFDSGGYLELPWGLGMGFGLAIADNVVDNFYFYIGFYEDHEPILPSELPKLTHGQWKEKGFVGAVFEFSEMDTKNQEEFFNSVYAIYKAEFED